MAYVAVDETQGRECIYDALPARKGTILGGVWVNFNDGLYITLPKGSIEKLIGRKLTWDDDPVELEGS